MAKQDVLDAINATIIENGQKGITAQALNNVLTMMTENAGEGGSGDGALRVMVPDMGMLFPLFYEFGGEFTPAVWEEIKAMLEESGDDFSDMDVAMSEAFAHNAKVYQTIKEKAIAGEGCLAILDQSYLGSCAMKLQFESYMPGMINNMFYSVSQPADCMFQLIDYNEAGEEAGQVDDEMCFLLPIDALGDGLTLYPTALSLMLTSEGGLEFDIPSVVLYLPEDNSVTLSDSMVADNEATISDLRSAIIKVSDLVLYKVAADGSSAEVKYSFVEYLLDDPSVFKYIDGLNLMQTTIDASDGATTTEVIGTLNAPTA